MKKTLNTSMRLTVAVAAIILFVGVLYAFISYQHSSSPESNSSSTTSSQEIAANEIPADFIPIYQEAAEEYEIPWKLLAAVHRIETVFSTMDPLLSPVGAEGHLQFMPCTWTGWSHPTCGEAGKGDISEETKTDPEAIAEYGGYGVDGSGSGTADPYDIEDAVFSAANYLAQSGADEGRLYDAVYAYNRADWYVLDVLDYMENYEEGYEEVHYEYALDYTNN
ncbi:lytic transglycosylase domain-containing protein [Alkalicoccus halolimnae]|uniref:Lytic transglycosylase domain-containing protein n=1 Tax=Alkalicoccus halolimnae TaxID=1667239 RepID=A0A5C7FD52_9BACI|nr:lytic transglycosylase domain-containing protein [Alkalicoccus halolimnae]TXF82726.1 lytic transglycosylase domain-containing protein [Alkalicoccus halolimnae]